MEQENTVLYKIIVRDGKNCVDLARFIDNNISKINAQGIYIKMERIDDPGVLKNMGIMRLPVMEVGPDRIIGKDKIIDFLLNGYTDANDEVSTQEYLLKTITPNNEPKTGGNKHDSSDSENENEQKEMMRKFHDYQKNVPKHRRSTEDRRHDNARDNTCDVRDNTRDTHDNTRDNTRDIYKNVHDTRTSNYDVDDEMMKAWMQNNYEQ